MCTERLREGWKEKQLDTEHESSKEVAVQATNVERRMVDDSFTQWARSIILQHYLGVSNVCCSLN